MTPNMHPVGVPVHTRRGVLGERTPRSIAADALEEEGRGDLAALLRSGWPVLSDATGGVTHAHPRLFEWLRHYGLDPLGGIGLSTVRLVPDMSHGMRNGLRRSDWVFTMPPDDLTAPAVESWLCLWRDTAGRKWAGPRSDPGMIGVDFARPGVRLAWGVPLPSGVFPSPSDTVPVEHVAESWAVTAWQWGDRRWPLPLPGVAALRL